MYSYIINPADVQLREVISAKRGMRHPLDCSILLDDSTSMNAYLLFCILTLSMLNCLTIIKDVCTFCIVSWILFNRRRWNSQWSNSTCCLSYIVNTMPVAATTTERGYQHAWFWSNKPGYSVSSIKRVNPSILTTVPVKQEQYGPAIKTVTFFLKYWWNII